METTQSLTYKRKCSPVSGDVRMMFFEFAKPLAAGIQQTFGPKCEVVLHDFKDPAHSIIWIQGNVTRRRVGGSVSEIGLEMIRGGDSEPDKINYVRNDRDGRIVKATTVLLRDPRGKVFGCLCINLDVTEFLAGRDALDAFLGQHGLREMRFSDQISEVLIDMIGATAKEIGRPPSIMTRDERRRFVRSLESKGAFTIQRSVPTAASYLRVSRTTIYKYLVEMRNGQNPRGGTEPPNTRTEKNHRDGR